MTFSSNVLCPHCSVILDLEPQHFAAYFDDREIVCTQAHCRKPFELWATLTGHVRDHDIFGTALRVAGATTVVCHVPIGLREVKPIELAPFGVPPDAELISVELTAEGGGLATLVHGRDALPDRLQGSTILVYAEPMVLHMRPAAVAHVEIKVTFIRRGVPLSLDFILEAARHFRAGRFDNMIVPAHIAAETSITPLLGRALGTAAPRRAYLKQLAHVARRAAAPGLPRALRHTLERLSDLRDDVAHTGTCAAQQRPEAAEHLVAAVLAMRYAEHLVAFVERALVAGTFH